VTQDHARTFNAGFTSVLACREQRPAAQEEECFRLSSHRCEQST
jgi:hypothetical protein